MHLQWHGDRVHIQLSILPGPSSKYTSNKSKSVSDKVKENLCALRDGLQRLLSKHILLFYNLYLCSIHYSIFQLPFVKGNLR